MNKEELKEMFNNIEIGDYFYNLKIEGVKEQDVDVVLQELAREHNVEFDITMNFYGNKQETVYYVIKPSKKFLDKRGCWSMPISNKVKEFLKTLEEE